MQSPTLTQGIVSPGHEPLVLEARDILGGKVPFSLSQRPRYACLILTQRVVLPGQRLAGQGRSAPFSRFALL